MVWIGLPRAPRPRNDGGEELQHYGLDCHAALAMTKKGKTENGLDYHPPRVG